MLALQQTLIKTFFNNPLEVHMGHIPRQPIFIVGFLLVTATFGVTHDLMIKIKAATHVKKIRRDWVKYSTVWTTYGGKRTVAILDGLYYDDAGVVRKLRLGVQRFGRYFPVVRSIEDTQPFR
jgi:hypothetical protein